MKKILVIVPVVLLLFATLYSSQQFGEVKAESEETTLNNVQIELNEPVLKNEVAKEKRRELISKSVETMKQKGKPAKEIDSMLQNKLNLTPAMGTVISSDDPSLMSVRDNVDIQRPYAYYDSQLGEYYAFAYFDWNDCNGVPCWKSDVNNEPIDGMGDENAFGIHFSEKVLRVSSEFKTYDQDERLQNTYSNPAEDNDYGVVYKGNDTYAYGYYTWDSGYLDMFFHRTNSNSTTVKAKLGHTWNSTGISSINLSNSGIGITFSQSISSWQAYGNQNFILD